MCEVQYMQFCQLSPISMTFVQRAKTADYTSPSIIKRLPHTFTALVFSN